MDRRVVDEVVIVIRFCHFSVELAMLEEEDFGEELDITRRKRVFTREVKGLTVSLGAVIAGVSISCG